ncbi:hypothetical protein HU763_016790 [Pseudomonas anuradhapurensis]|uniref:hypothetical protein n=1 Tax=Pseudomonas anuradhapurensis TaxID=485870 RepID=UPI0016496E0B|nr:hypothetical protein [Pseudomonas anuradhapurensis]QXI46424.1 hypothetical protein HU763_016790 [Pseudomonas anuradhapurensis]
MNQRLTPPARLIDLPAPSIPAAANGGLGYYDIEYDPLGFTIVTVGPYFEMLEGDLVEVFFGTKRVAFHIADTGDTSTINIKVPNREIKDLGDGEYTVTYTIVFFIGGGSVKSVETPVLVKLSVPGGLDPRPDTPELNENLASPFVIPDPVPDSAQSATVFVSPWLNMAADDVLTVSWGGHMRSLSPLLPGEVNRQQQVMIDRAMLEAVGGGRVPVTYEIRDKVNNRSLWAPYKNTDVEIEDPNAPEAPSVIANGAPVTEIDLAVLGSDDATVWVPRFDDIQPGQQVVVEWRGLTAANAPVDHDSGPQPVPNPLPFYLEFKIPNAKVITLGQGSVRVSYVVDGRRVSKKVLLPVKGQPLVLRAPEVPDAVAGELDPAVVPTGARFIVPAQPGIPQDARIDIYWDGVTSGGLPAKYSDNRTVSDPSQPLLFTIPASAITIIAGGSVTAHYTVNNGGTLLLSPQLPLRVKAASTQPLPAPTVDGVQNGVIDANLPSTFIRIPQYPDMAVQDVITGHWLAPMATSGQVTVVTVGPQEIPIAGTYIAGNLNSTVTVNYSIPGKGRSSSLSFTVEGATIVPVAPRVPKASGGRLNVQNDMYYDDFLEVEVPPFQGMANGQAIELEWVGPYFTWRDRQTVGTPQTLRFQVPRLEVIDAIGRSVQIRYTVNGTTPSPSFVLNIDSQGMEMPPPRYFPQEGSPTAAVSILSPDQQTGHTGRVRLYGINPAPWDSTEEYLQAETPKYFQVPRSIVEENRGRVVLINYSIYRGNNERFRFSRVLRQQL